MNSAQGLAVLVFIVVFILIAVEVIHRTYASLLGALIFLFLGAVSPDQVLQFIDIEILAVVMGLFLMVRGAERSGIFQYFAVKIMKNSGSATAFAVILLTFTIILAVFVSNIGAMLVMASITITMARSLKIKPQTLLVYQSVVINIGGMILWTGSIPNIIIGIEAGFSFMDFIYHVMPLGIILYLSTLLVFIRIFRKEFTPKPEADFRDLEFDEWIERAIEVSGLEVASFNRGSLAAAAVMVLTIAGFVVYESLHLTPALVALTGGFLMMMIQTQEPQGVLREIDWSTLLFLGGLFVMINGLSEIGVISSLSHWLSGLMGGQPLEASIRLMWLSGVASSVVDNIPLSSSLAPIIKEIVVDPSWRNLWWGLVIGTNLGGNMTPIGSPSNIIAIGVSEQEGYPLNFNMFLKTGLRLTLMNFIISMAYIYIRYGVLAG
ncbi:MAG: SLC13 family permease [Candidatus Bathyarchaeota archaeon]|jgi:Na+/H+ antiporter NhaD/arsenite permease-like protein